MRVCFLPNGDRQWAGSRLRAWSVADHLEGASCVQWKGVPPPGILEYDAVVFQKLYDRYSMVNQEAILTLAKDLRRGGSKVFWDLCDPIWWWNEPHWVREFAECCNGIVVSNEGLANDFESSFKIIPTVIEDRLPFVQEFRIHEFETPPTMVWFGYAMNRGPSLSGMGLVLSRLCYSTIPFRLLIIDDYPKTQGWDETRIWSDRTTYHKWSLDTIHHDLCQCDLALLPPFPGPWGSMKSRNKQMTAWWAGLPVHDRQDFYSLKELLKYRELRREHGMKNRAEAERHFEITTSVDEWKHLIAIS
jgi:hypothetical protein